MNLTVAGSLTVRDTLAAGLAAGFDAAICTGLPVVRLNCDGLMRRLLMLGGVVSGGVASVIGTSGAGGMSGAGGTAGSTPVIRATFFDSSSDTHSVF